MIGTRHTVSEEPQSPPARHPASIASLATLAPFVVLQSLQHPGLRCCEQLHITAVDLTLFILPELVSHLYTEKKGVEVVVDALPLLTRGLDGDKDGGAK